MSRKRVTSYRMSDTLAIILMALVLLIGWDEARANWAVTISDGDTHTTPEWEDYEQCAWWNEQIEKTDLLTTGCFWVNEYITFWEIEVRTKGALDLVFRSDMLYSERECNMLQRNYWRGSVEVDCVMTTVSEFLIWE
jgi:hypothetical protein